MAAAKQREPSPPQQLRTLEGESELAPGYVLRGEERYFRERALDLLRARAREAGYEICLADSADPDFELQSLLDDLSSCSLFGGPRCVIVRGADALLATRSKEPTPTTRALKAFLASPQLEGLVILAAEKLRADHAAVKAVLAAGGKLIACRKLWDSPPHWNPDPRQAELVQWTGARARELGLRLDPNQAAYVAAATGNDLYAIDGQIEKLKTSGGEALQAVVGWQAGGSPFAVAEEFLAGEAARALAGVESLFQGGFQDRSGGRVVDSSALTAMLVGALVRQTRQHLAVGLALAAGRDAQQALAEASFRGPPQARDKLLAGARRRPPGTWGAMLEEACELERRFKSGSVVDVNDFARLALRWRR